MSSPLNLREKTVVLVGPMTPIMQTLTLGLTQLGADLGLVNHDIDASRRFAAQVTDAREINSSFGRAFAIATDFKDETQIKDSISRVAESFGGIDTYIDTRSCINLSWGQTEDHGYSESEVVDSKLAVTEEVLPFLKGRKKGRILYVSQQAFFEKEDSDFSLARQKLVEKVTSLGEELAPFNVGINMLTVQLTEEYLLYHFKGKSIQEATAELQTQFPNVSVTEFERVTNSVAFMISSMSAGITGQHIFVR